MQLICYNAVHDESAKHLSLCLSAICSRKAPQPGLSSIPAMQKIRDFLGREPDSAALIERYSQHTP